MRNLLIPLLPKYGGFKLAKIIKFFLTLIFTIFLILTLLFIIVMTTYVKEKYYVIQLSVIRITKIRNNYSLDFNSYGDTKKTLNLEITSKGKLPENIVIKKINFYYELYINLYCVFMLGYTLYILKKLSFFSYFF